MIELYQKENCPFCKKVREALNELELDFVCRISREGTYQREVMMKLGGKAMVPFLVDQSNSIMMYESDDIIEYLKDNYGMEEHDHDGECCGQGCHTDEEGKPKVCAVE